MTASRGSPPRRTLAAACLLLRGVAARGRLTRGGDREAAAPRRDPEDAAPGGRGLSVSSSRPWYVDWGDRQCVQSCDVNSKSLRSAACGGGAENLPRKELFRSSRECCKGMLSWLPYEECVRGYDNDGDDTDGCPAPYDPSAAYSERDEVTLDGTIYRCKAGPTWPWCNQFRPDYEVHASSQVVHRTKDDLGWQAIDSCGPPNDAARTKTTAKTTIRGGIVKSGNRDANGRRKRNEDLRDIMDSSWDGSRDTSRDKSKENDKNKNKDKGKDKDKRKSKEKGKGKGVVVKNNDKNGEKNKGKNGMDIMGEIKDDGKGKNNNKGKDRSKGKDKDKDRDKGKSKNGNKDKDKDKDKDSNKDKDKGKNNNSKDKDKGKNKGNNKIQKRQSSQGQCTVVLGATNDFYVDRRDHDDVQSLVRFDLSSFYEGGPCALGRAVLWLHPLASCRGRTIVEVVAARGGEDVDWSGVTWTKAPQRVGPKSAQPLIDRSFVEEGEGFEVDVTSAVEWTARVRRNMYVVFRLRAKDERGSCVLASAERGQGEDGPTLELYGRPERRGTAPAKRPSKQQRPVSRPRDRDGDDSEDYAFARARGKGGVYTDGILLQREFHPCNIEEYLGGAEECVDGLTCYHPYGVSSGFGTCRKIGRLAGRDEPCDASFRRACRDEDCECLRTDGAGLGRRGTRTGVCRVPPGGMVTEKQLDTITVTDIIRMEGESCQIERYLDGEEECVDGLVCYEPNGLLSGLGICTEPHPPPGRDGGYTPFLENTNTAGGEKWYVDYSLGSEGQCVMDCVGGSFCGGPAKVWDELFRTPELCCTQKLWWMPRCQCVPEENTETENKRMDEEVEGQELHDRPCTMEQSMSADSDER